MRIDLDWKQRFALLFACMPVLACGDGHTAECAGRNPVHVGVADVMDTSGATADAWRCIKLVTGNLTISDPAVLANLVQVQGDLEITGVSVKDLSALSHLTEVDGKLTIDKNPGLKSLHGLEGVTETGSALEITNNPKLVNLRGLSGLRFVNGDLTISQNEALVSLEGMKKVPVGGSVILSSNAAFTDLTRDALSRVGSSLLIESNRSLETIDALPTTIGDDPAPAPQAGLFCHGAFRLQIGGNTALKQITADPRLGTAGCIDVSSNPALTTLELDTTAICDSPLKSIVLLEDPKLVTLQVCRPQDALELSEDLVVQNTGLASLDGLSGVYRVGDSLWVEKNPNLTKFGFSKLDLGNIAHVEDNPKLPACLVDELAAQIAKEPDHVVMTDSGLQLTHPMLAQSGNDTHAKCP
jgi:hypothetical protein